MVRFDRHPVRRLARGHRRMAGQQVYQKAFMGRIEMLDDNEGDAAGGWESA